MTDMSKVGRSSRRKAKRFEREIAKKISLLWCRDDETIRKTPESGGQYWPGDLWHPDTPREFPFMVECRYREITHFSERVHEPRWQTEPLSWFTEIDDMVSTADFEQAWGNLLPILVVKPGPRRMTYWVTREEAVNDSCDIPFRIPLSFKPSQPDGIGAVFFPQQAVLDLKDPRESDNPITLYQIDR